MLSKETEFAFESLRLKQLLRECEIDIKLAYNETFTDENKEHALKCLNMIHECIVRNSEEARLEENQNGLARAFGWRND